MNRVAGIIVFIVGLVIAVLGFTKIVPYMSGGGVAFAITGILIFALSFIKKPDTENVERMSTPQTLTDIFYSPGEVFQNLRRHSRWLVALLILSSLAIIYHNLFIQRMTPERVANFSIDKTLEMPMLANNDQAKQQIEKGRPEAIEQLKSVGGRIGAAFGSFSGLFIFNAFIAGFFFLVILVTGGKINYLQAFSSAIYASFPVTVIRFILNTALLYVKDPADIHPLRGQQNLIQDNLDFLVSASAHPVIFSILGMLSLTFIYWIVMNAIGLKNTGEKVSSGGAWSASIGFYILILLFISVISFLFPNFVS